MVLIQCLLLFVLSPSTLSSGNRTVNSTSVTYGILPGTLDPNLPKTLAQVALSPLLLASSFNHLPLQSLFPQIQAMHENSSKFSLTSVLLNHSLHHGSDEELDRLVFSNLPQGSKLVLKTVKIVKTDEDGNEEAVGDPAISFDVLPIGSGSGTGDEMDLETDASSQGHDAKHYDSKTVNDKEKHQSEDYHRGQDFGQGHTETLTDSHGKKVKDYKGREKGITDYDKGHGNLESNDGERFKNSKKTNKGRKVTGFKRVYHKEEFQRTEHFYDDEEAKKIAESFGLSDNKEKKEHGKKDDDRKYQGGRIENSEGNKVKNEHVTHHGHHKGQQFGHGQADKHKYSQHQSIHHHPNHRYSPTSSSYDPNTASAQQKPVPFGPKLHLKKSSSNGPGDEVKIYRAQTTRQATPPNPETYYYAPNFGPPPSTTTDPAVLKYYRQGHYSATNGSRPMPVTTPRMKINSEDRYAKQFPTPRPVFHDPLPRRHYSSLVTVNSPSVQNHPPPPIPFYHTGKNLISIDKAVVTRFPVQSPEKGFSVPDSRGVFFQSGFTDWNPIPSGSVNTPLTPSPKWAQAQARNTSTVNMTARYPGNNFGYHKPAQAPHSIPRPPASQQRPIRPEIPVRSQGFKPSLPATPTLPSIPNLPISSTFYDGPTLIINHDNYHNGGRRGPPSFSNFMNSLMNTVSEFFSRMG